MISALDNLKTGWDELLISEQLVFGLFGKLLFEYPEKEWFDVLVNQGVFDEIPLGEDQKEVQDGMKLLSAWNQTYSDGLTVEGFEAVRDDYTRLFVGPGKVLAPVWESMYFTKERSIFQKETLEVRDWYRRYGVESVKLYHEPDDHLGLELAFVAHLAGLAHAALESGDQEKFQELLTAQREFLSKHTFQWVAGWSALVLEHARTDFYKGVALVVRGVLAEMKDVLVEG